MDNFKFSTQLTVQIGDINYGGHLGNDKYLSLFQEGRLRYLHQFGYSELSIGEETSLIMSQSHVNYRAEAFWGDPLIVSVKITDIKSAKFTIHYKIMHRDDVQKIIATGYTEMVGFDYKNRKIKRLPEKFVHQISDFEGDSK